MVTDLCGAVAFGGQKEIQGVVVTVDEGVDPRDYPQGGSPTWQRASRWVS